MLGMGKGYKVYLYYADGKYLGKSKELELSDEDLKAVAKVLKK